VGAAPHRGNANRPLTIQGKAPKPEQGKAKAIRILTISAPISKLMKSRNKQRKYNNTKIK
ncbi:hypothetical protein, partial [Paraburkholderia nemoris]|uniref:hypothetical protein n=1 Tax=Paraburkholderia nemoris TaxID=2793076 RepID=UPI0038B8AC46